MQELLEWLRSNGFEFTPSLDGKIGRFSFNGKNNDAGWYIGSTEMLPSGKIVTSITVGDWSTGEKLYWRSGKGFSNGEAEKYREQIAAKTKSLEAESEKRHAEAAAKASEIWHLAPLKPLSETLNHPYLIKKKIDLQVCIKQIDGKVVIPMYQNEGEICGLQFISEGGEKRFLPGTRKMGAFFEIPGRDFEVILIAEGLATASSLSQATGLTTFVAFDCGNLKPVAVKIKNLYPSSQIWICGDDDRSKTGTQNSGRQKAELAAKEIGANCVFPSFICSDNSNLTDFNDLHCEEGLDAVKKQIEEVVNRERIARCYVKSERDDEKAIGQPLGNPVVLAGATAVGGDIGEKPKKERKKRQREKSANSVALEFLQHFGYLSDDVCSLRYYQQDFYRYRDNHYQLVDDEWIKDKLNRWLIQSGHEDWAGVDAKTRPVMNMIKTKPVYVGGRNELPCLIQKDWKTKKVPHLIPLKNGLFNIKKFAKDKELEVLPHTPDFFCRYVLPYELDISATCPTYDSLTKDIFNNDEEISIWEEVMGVHIYMPFLIEKFFILCGEGANGKSVLRTILTCLLGSDNVSTVPLECFNPSSFAFINTVGKLANIIPDMKDIAEIDEGVLKQFVSREPMTFNRKMKPFISSTPTSFLTVCTNVLPKFTDKSEGIWRRMMLFNFRKEIPQEKQNPLLREPGFWNKSGELPGIFNKALNGIIRVIERGHIVGTKIMDDEVSEYRHELNFIMQFASEYLVFNKDVKSKSSDVYQAYKKMITESGGKALGAPTFSRQLKATCNKMGHRIDFSEENKRIGSYVGRIWYGTQLRLDLDIT